MQLKNLKKMVVELFLLLSTAIMLAKVLWQEWKL
jgi:hypothetical protein